MAVTSHSAVASRVSTFRRSSAFFCRLKTRLRPFDMYSFSLEKPASIAPSTSSAIAAHASIV